MKLEGKKELVARALGVGKGRVVFNKSRLNEIKEVITRQDVVELKNSGAIIVKEKRGRRTKKKRKTRRRQGSIKKKVKQRKREYVLLTRKLREHLKRLKERGQISREDYIELRKQVRARAFRSLAQMKEKIKEMQNE
ncbi:50S ribosomal protein L19e [Candidatus Pacearchaeota archaeon]|nr:MAG: 50S ribosomal protein L19e [Candidatus Pacearchaeota archaeon]